MGSQQAWDLPQTSHIRLSLSCREGPSGFFVPDAHCESLFVMPTPRCEWPVATSRPSPHLGRRVVALVEFFIGGLQALRRTAKDKARVVELRVDVREKSESLRFVAEFGLQMDNICRR